MGRYKRKTDRQSWNGESMKLAVQAVLDGEMGYRKASANFNVPQTTLERRVKKARENGLAPAVASEKSLGRYKSVFSKEQEEELAQYIFNMEERLFGLTLMDLRHLAFELSEANGIKHNFNREKKAAGKDWLYAFLQRNPRISLRNPEQTSLARAKGFNRDAVNKFFDLLENVLKTHQISPKDIYNVDETGITTVPNKPSRILAMRGKKQVGALSSSERGTLVTAETCVNAAGNFMPTMFVFPRKRENPALMDDALPGSFAYYHETGWITTDSFLVWFKQFIEFSNPKPDKPVLLLLDGHRAHSKSIALINAAREKNVILLCFPPHTSHRLQPLDVSFMAPLSVYYEQEVRKWLINHPGRVVTIAQVAKLYSSAFQRAASVQTAVKGFEKSGICPFNRDVFPDSAFAPSETTERPMEQTQDQIDRPSTLGHISSREPTPHQLTSVDNTPSTSGTSCANVQSLVSFPDRPNVVPQTSSCLTSALVVQQTHPSSSKSSGKDLLSNRQNVQSTPGPSRPSSSFMKMSPSELMPPPQERERIRNTAHNKRRGKTAVLTSSPYKKELEDEERARNMKDKPKKKLFKQPKTKTKPNLKKTTDSRSNENSQNKEVTSSTKRIKLESRNDLTSSSEDEGNEDEACIFCNEIYSASKEKEGWIKCSGCSGWAHEDCSNAEEEDDDFICDFCKIVSTRR